MTIIEMSEVLGNFGEFFGALLLVASLVYVGIQVRQNTVATKAQIQQARANGLQELEIFTAKSEPIVAVIVKMSGDIEDISGFSPSELVRCRGILSMWHNRIQNLIIQHREGFIDEDSFREEMHNVLPRLDRLWQKFGLDVSPTVRNQLNQILNEEK